MTEEISIQKPLTEQILDEMFASIEGLEEFDAQTLQQLKQVTKGGGLTKATQVVKALKFMPKENSNETA